ncbi:MFS general substrate transporter [Testicularia cyperi]|uniref:MFS general substrate transporter n=1 Tax=Testicularia cyperi TaxID=1882483 RepID=A0A317XN73_9BASI|nr:MFS general substrate transporter [Testicularia cyperi]
MFSGSFASTAPNGAASFLVARFDLSDAEMIFVSTSFVGGCVAGPILWAPLSELYGRSKTFLISTLLFVAANVGSALSSSKNMLFSFRLITGIFASSAFSNGAAVVSDLFLPSDRGNPMIVLSLSPLLGPCFGPLVGSLVGTRYDWRCVFWVLAGVGLVLELILIFVPETYPPLVAKRPSLVEREAKRDMGPWAPRLRKLLLINLGRPLNMMFREPIVICATTYLSFFFALMYVYFSSWPLIFGPPGIYKLSPVHTGLTFVPMAIGGVMGSLFCPYFNRRYRKKCREAQMPVPEARLLPTYYVAPCVAFGFLWSGWMSRETVPFAVPMLAGIPIGAAMVLVFQGWIGYLGDCYRLYASSAIAATVIGRSLSGATLPLSTHMLHERLGGIANMYTLLACLVALAIPVPYYFAKYGERMRNRSAYELGR